MSSENSDLGGFKIYSTVAQLGLTSATVTDLKQVVNAMPDMSRLCCSADGQFPNIVFPTSYGTLEIIRININRVSLKYYVSIPDAIGKTYTGSYHSNSDFSGWFNFLTNADLKVKYGFATVAAKQNETVSFNVTFDEAFKVLPAVVSTVTTTQPSENHTSINNVTVNGFTGFLYRAGASGNINVRWIAVGK